MRFTAESLREIYTRAISGQRRFTPFSVSVKTADVWTNFAEMVNEIIAQDEAPLADELNRLHEQEQQLAQFNETSEMLAKEIIARRARLGLRVKWSEPGE